MENYNQFSDKNLCSECAAPKPPGGKMCPSCRDRADMREDRAQEVMVYDPRA